MRRMPMGKYDITLRHLIRSGGREFLRAIGTEGHVTHVQTEFPSTRERRVDSLAVVDSANDARTSSTSNSRQRRTRRCRGACWNIIAISWLGLTRAGAL